jgi:benzoylformate decarboxylase
MDDGDRPCHRLPLLRKVSRHLSADPHALSDVIEALTAARSPVLVIGGAVDQSGGWDDAVALAETLRCDVWAAPGEGRPGFPETHPQYRGMLPPAIGPLAQALSGHDVIVVVGAPVFRYYPYVPGEYLPEGAELFHITDDPSEAARAPVGTAILADPGRSCAVLAENVPQANRALAAAQPASVPAQVDGRITAEWLYHTIQTVRPTESVIVQESLSTLRALRQQIPTDQPRSFFSMSSGVLGYGLPAAVGVALAERDEGTNRKVICIVGDGAANYVIQSIWTATQHDLPILFVVVRNGAYNILKSFADLLETPGVPGLDLPGLDFLGLAQGYGCTSERVTSADALQEVIKRGMDTDRPHLVEVLIDATVPPLI